MIRVDPFHPRDLDPMIVQPGQSEVPADRLSYGVSMAAAGPCFTIRRAAGGVPLFCGGAIVVHPQLATLWSVFADDAGPFMTAITRRTRWFVATLSHRRVDAWARVGFAPANRWLTMLGFEVDVPVPDYFENGDDAMVYRLKRGSR